jgi:hypothetical protein
MTGTSRWSVSSLFLGALDGDPSFAERTVVSQDRTRVVIAGLLRVGEQREMPT